MRKYNPYKNIFYYYRGPSQKKNNVLGDKQIEDNTTKALINTLENSDVKLLKSFLNHINLKPKSFETVRYDLQIVEEYSRPDALIDVGSTKIYIESKVDCFLDKEQIKNHLKVAGNGYLLCITPRKKDGKLIEEFTDTRLKFITWQEIYTCFHDFLINFKHCENAFIIRQFLDYLEATGMATFYGWNKSHFEAFINIEDDPKKELRYRVRDYLSQYLTELKEYPQNKIMMDNFESKVGNISEKDSRSCWGVLCKPPLTNLVHKPHFNFSINADEFVIGVQVEGKEPAYYLKKIISDNQKSFLDIVRRMEDFHLTIRERIQSNPRNFYGVPVTQILLGKNIRQHDIDYLINKMNQFSLFEINCTKFYKRDALELVQKSFLKTSIDVLKTLEPYYNFCLKS